MSNQYRYDRAEIKTWEMTGEGYLRFLAPISREGYLNYSDGKGGVRREYVSAKTLRDSAHSFVNKPICITHPPVPVTAENAKEYAVGWTGNAAKLDTRGVLWLSGTVFDADGIESIRSGKTREISAGYGVKISDRGDGTFEQEVRIGNHIAAVPKGRAGSEVAFKFDSDDELLMSEDAIVADDPPDLPQTKASTRSRRKDKHMITVNLDGVTLVLNEDSSTVEAQRHVNAVNGELTKLRSQSTTLAERGDSDKTTIAELKQQLKDAEAEKKQLTTDLDATQAKLDALQLDMDEMGDRGDSSDGVDVEKVLAEHLPERMELWTEVLPMFRSDNADFEPDYLLKPVEIMTAALKFAKPELEEHLDSLDLDDPEAIGAVKGMYTMLNPAQQAHKSAKAKNRVDSMLGHIKENRVALNLDTGDTGEAEKQMEKVRSGYTNASKKRRNGGNN